MAEYKKDLVIIGSGPAGLSAAVYAQRALLDQVVIEQESYSGGQIVTTERVDNYLGLYGENGYDLSVKFREHADTLGVPFLEGEVTEIVDDGAVKRILLQDGTTIDTDAVLIATGAKHRLLGCKGETEYSGAGVSYCATCDGAFFKGRTVVVVGGGDVALEDALYLSNICDTVYLVHRRKELRGAPILQKKIREKENILFLPYYEVAGIGGSHTVEWVSLIQNQTGEAKRLSVSGVFIAVGMEPQSGLAAGLVKQDAAGFLCAGEDCRTNRAGIYAAGDVRTKPLRQVITAAADGAAAIASIEQDRH